MPVPDLVASRHVTSDVTPRHDVVRKKIGVNRRNIYNTLQLVLAAREPKSSLYIFFNKYRS